MLTSTACGNHANITASCNGTCRCLPAHLWQQAWTIGQAVLGRRVGKVVELNFVDSPALSTDVDADVNGHGTIQLVVGGLHPELQSETPVLPWLTCVDGRMQHKECLQQ